MLLARALLGGRRKGRFDRTLPACSRRLQLQVDSLRRECDVWRMSFLDLDSERDLYVSPLSSVAPACSHQRSARELELTADSLRVCADGGTSSKTSSRRSHAWLVTVLLRPCWSARTTIRRLATWTGVRPRTRQRYVAPVVLYSTSLADDCFHRQDTYTLALMDAETVCVRCLAKEVCFVRRLTITSPNAGRVSFRVASSRRAARAARGQPAS